MKFEINIVSILLLYLIALGATIVDRTVGMVAFICMTVVVVILYLCPFLFDRVKNGEG